MKALAKTLCAIAAVISALTFTVEARKIRTKHSIPKGTEKSVTVKDVEQPACISIATDSIAFCDSIRPAIRFYGFDKTVSSSTESFFISNGFKSALSGMEIRITYTDMKGRQLHKRTVKIDTPIPAAETMRTDVKSWDTQKSFYYHKSVKPKRQATPFDVKVELLSVTL